ncbi:MAG TPA: carboxymuconolactone decarboxylase family protein [Casimicrobiaceae bacterium]|nr:carboxymuconolactone decarboxylase family protein [Casimicrobiaceae bacterium]
MARIDLHNVNPAAYAAMLNLQKYVNAAPLDHKMMELVKMRASQINGCAYCLDMHSQDARAAGETEARLHVLAAWHEAPFYTDRERAALAWTEAVTLVADTHVPDEAYEEARKHFSEKELVDLTLAIVTINGWNRLCVAFRVPPGTYKPKGAAREAS